VAVELARAGRRRGATSLLADADEVAPSLAQRLGLPPIPNLRTAIDALFHGAGRLHDALLPVAAGGFELLAGLANPADWPQVRPQEAAEVVDELRGLRDHVIVNVGPHTEDLGRLGAADRYGVTREVLRGADVVVGVGVATPVGVARLVSWIADVVLLAPGRPVHLVVNKAPASRFVRGEVEAEILRNFAPASLTVLPLDPAVEKAAWRGELVAPGPFTRAVEALADAALAQGAGAVTAPGPRTEPRAVLRRRKGPA
jgi:MinD-like ATPase involved in chromosome partitioning or flagellar assembly